MNRAQNISINVYSLLLYSITFYTLVTLSYSLFPNIPLNKFFVMCITFITLYLYIKRLTITRILILIGCIFFSIYTMLISNYPQSNFQDLSWMLTTVLIIGIATDKTFQSGLEHAIKRNKKNILLVIILIEVILLIAVFTPGSYGNAWGWGEGASYFVGFATNGHTLASTSCLLIVLIMTVFHDRKINITEYVLLILPIYSIFFSGARTFLISLLILLILNVYMKKNSLFIRQLTICALLFSLVFVFLNSSMISKFQFTVNNIYAQNMLDAITNGRSVFWMINLELFSSSNLFIQLFGRGFDYIYEYNFQKIGVRIWAHNDIINSLISIGIIGTIGYLLIWFKYIHHFTSKSLFSSNIKFLLLLISLYVIVPMFINGLYQYQHYIFSCVLLGQLVNQNKKVKEEGELIPVKLS